MFTAKNITFICIYTLLFTVLIFLGREIFFGQERKEELYIEPQLGEDFEVIENNTAFYSFSGTSQKEVNATLSQLILDAYNKEQQADSIESKIDLYYVPGTIESQLQTSHLPLMEAFLSYKPVTQIIEHLALFLYEKSGEVRGRMKAEKIHIFGVPKMGEEEFLSVFIHEFGHYFDIYSLKKSQFGDESQKFYSLSWESQSQMRKQLGQNDFVSGYAMTNQYEDFAESYVYYILHNKDFFTKTLSSSILRQKYEFFEKYVFPQKEFYKENFSLETDSPKSYYWDITKISVDIKKFLQYVKKEV